MVRYKTSLICLALCVLMLVVGLLDINYHYLGLYEFKGVLSIPIGGIIGSLLGMYLHYRDSNKP